MTDHIRVMIVDDHLIVRRGLATLLCTVPDIEVVGEASTGAEAVHVCAQLRPDVVLMDLKLPGLDGVAATRAIREANPGVQVIALTCGYDDELVSEALRAGVIGYLLKDIGVLGLDNAIRAAVLRQPTLAPEATQALVRRATASAAPQQSLTDREREVLAQMVNGLSNAEIADQLVLSRSTVNFHVSHVLAKLDVTCRAAAVSVALRRRLVD
jgi:two-component system, NarL family, response regulator LiaR